MKKLAVLVSMFFFTGLAVSEAQMQRSQKLQKVRPARAERVKPKEGIGARDIGIMIAQGRPEGEVIKHWENLIRMRRSQQKPVDIYELVQQVLHEGYCEMSRDMQHHSSRVQQFNNMKKKIRQEVNKLRRARKIKSWKPNDAPRHNRLEKGPGWKIKLIQGRRLESADALDETIRHWEEQLATIGDDAQLANIDLQNMLQKQQQAIQMLSNISKVLHDTALAVIRKIG